MARLLGSWVPGRLVCQTALDLHQHGKIAHVLPIS